MTAEPEDTAQQFFYHSFPRARAGEAAEAHIDRAERILASMVDMGLLLTPERFLWQERLENGGLGPEVVLWQKRICLTELSPRELRGHAMAFGPFALEFGLDEFLQMGGMPVFYLPSVPESPRGSEGLGAAFMTRLAEVNAILRRIDELHALANQSMDERATLLMEIPGGPTIRFRTGVRGMQDVLGYLTMEGQPASSLRGSMNAFSGLFSPTENLRYTERLRYYRQREWRILAAGLAMYGAELAREVTDVEARALERLDPTYFSRPLEDPLRSDRNRAQESRVISQLHGRHALEWARRVIVPAAAVASVKRTLSQLDHPPEVIASESL